MKQWFSGKFRGHYRGRPSEPSQLAPFPGAPHFSIEVYEALVSEIELGPLIFDPPSEPGDPKTAGDQDAEDSEAPTPLAKPAAALPQGSVSAHHTPAGPALHQAHIGKVHLIDPIKLGQTVRSTAHDVLMSGIELSRPAEYSRGTLGHIEGTISGWYRPPPPPPEVEEVPALEGPVPVGWRTEVLEKDNDAAEDSAPDTGGPSSSEASRVPPSGKLSSQAAAAPSNEDRETHLDDDLENDAELDALLSEEAPNIEYPFFSMGMGITLLLAFFATPFAAILFGVTFLLSYGVRRWLLGVVPDAAAMRVLALILGSTQILVAALLISRWATVGCVSLSLLPLIWLLGAMMTSSLLPRPLAFALTTAGFAAVLLQAYASWAPPLCSAEGALPGETLPERGEIAPENGLTPPESGPSPIESVPAPSTMP